MGELNLDNIDRALIQEYKRCHDGRRLKEEAKAIDNLQPGQKVPPHILRFQLFPDGNYASTYKR